MAKSIRIRLLIAAVLMSGSIRMTAATIGVFLNPSTFSGKETLIEFDGLGLVPSSEVRSVLGVGFSLIQKGTLTDTGFGPTVASAPNSTYAREFPPRDGPIFLNMINFSAPDVDLQIDFPEAVFRVAAEIRSGQTGNDVHDLSFELYRKGLLIGETTLQIRGQNNFFFYGLESGVGFDRWVIRQQPDYRFDLENLRFQAIPEPGTISLAIIGLTGLLACCRSRRGVLPF